LLYKINALILLFNYPKHQFMKKTFTLLVCILFTLSASAQNYHCILPGVKRFFINETGYLRGIRIDSITEFSDYKIYYPFKTPRKYRDFYFEYGVKGAFDTAGGSWVGEKIISQNDGTYLFDTYFGDTVVIKTQAAVGESWVFLNDTSLIYYKATVTSKSARAIDGVIDSVKVITVKAYHQITGLIADPVDDLKIIVSKNHGFYEVFDLHMFPHRLVMPKNPSIYIIELHTFDYFFEFADKQQFRQTSIYIPRNEEFYNYKVGDVLRTTEHTTTTISGESIFLTNEVIRIDSTYSDKIIYIYNTVSRKLKSESGVHYSIDTTTYYESGFVAHFGVSTILDTTLMPEEHGNESIYHYIPNDSSFCTLSPLYSRTTMNRINFGGTYEKCYNNQTLKINVGEIYTSHCQDAMYNNKILSIFKKNQHFLCSNNSTIPISTDIITLNNNIKIYPNPANNTVKVDLPDNGIYSIYITTYMGQTVYANEKCSNTHTVNTENLPTGLYIVYITDKNGTKNTTKLSITH